MGARFQMEDVVASNSCSTLLQGSDKLAALPSRSPTHSPPYKHKPVCCCLVTKSCPTLCIPMNCSQPGSSVHGISQVRILEWVAMFSSRGSSRPRDRTLPPALAGGFFTTKPPGQPSVGGQF